MRKKEVNYYFKTFIESFNYAREAVAYLDEVVSNFNGGITEEQKDKMHRIEHNADLFLRDVLAKLSKEFITPIANEDILIIIKKIDDITDSIEDILINMYIYDIKKTSSISTKFINIIKRECNAMAEVLEEFPNFKKSHTLKDKIMKVLTIEEEGDRLFISSIRELYQTTQDFKEIHKIESLILAYETCCDAIEEVVQAVDEAVMKNA